MFGVLGEHGPQFLRTVDVLRRDAVALRDAGEVQTGNVQAGRVRDAQSPPNQRRAPYVPLRSSTTVSGTRCWAAVHRAVMP